MRTRPQSNPTSTSAGCPSRPAAPFVELRYATNVSVRTADGYRVLTRVDGRNVRLFASMKF